MNGSPRSSRSSLHWTEAIAANLLSLACLLVGLALLESDPDGYYRLVQEDQPLEWATVLSFLGATWLFAWAAIKERRETGAVPWFASGVALFCFFVAMEEVSWFQRVFAYKPPAYFLEHNFQQEFNLHNIVDNDLRKLAVKLVLGGYGVVLSLAALVRPFRSLLRKIGIEAPPVEVLPIFLGSLIAYESYPWDFTGEWVELLMGFGFLGAALAAYDRFSAPSSWRPPLRVVALWVLTIVAGIGLAAASDLRASRPEMITAAQAELETLARDVEDLRRPCQRKGHLNKRVYSYIEKYGEDDLFTGAFAGLVEQGLPEDRGQFFLDPWNSPYWIQCTDRGGRSFNYLYSFGPNRRRESTRWEILGDDIGQVFEIDD